MSRQRGVIEYALVAVLAVLAASVIALFFSRAEVKSEREKNLKLTGQIAEVRQESAQFKETSATCTASVENFEKAAKDAKAEAVKAKAALADEQKKQGGRVVTIISAPRPEGTTECDAAKLEVRNAILDRGNSPFR